MVWSGIFESLGYTFIEKTFIDKIFKLKKHQVNLSKLILNMRSLFK